MAKEAMHKMQHGTFHTFDNDKIQTASDSLKYHANFLIGFAQGL